MATTSDPFVPFAPLEALQTEGRIVKSIGGTPLAGFWHESSAFVTDNRCPHMGFPLSEGSVEDGILTCHWHHARFELSCGDTFDPWADDVRTYPVEIRDGTVYVDPNPEPANPPAIHWGNRIEVGLERNLRLVIAKGVIGVDDAGVDAAETIVRGVDFGTRYREGGWGPGLTILTALGNVLPALDAEDRRRALYQGLLHVAGDCAEQPPKFDHASFGARDIGFERLRSWFRRCIDVRDADGAERCLRTAVASGRSPAELADLLVTAATDHRYLDTGHTFDFINKACESLDITGWDDPERTADTLASVVAGLATASRSEERSSWRQPIDLVAMLDASFARLDELVAAGSNESWTAPEDFLETLLSDDPDAIVEALETAIRSGATVEQLADRVALAAGTRVARFSTANEFSDWNTVHHTFTYANAVHRASRRTDPGELYRGVFDGAVNVYLDRFLTTPPAPTPEPDSDADPDAELAGLREAFEREGEVNAAGAHAARFLDAGGDPDRLWAELGNGLLCEDANFHTYQAYEAAHTQFRARDDPEERRTVAIGAARYLSAHFPTRRAREQTFTIATRLRRGESIHDAETTAD
ncbi:Rieske (2Fe-2S) protein [Haloferacaceae archaeon DSL9]